jgi:hypothetical protein
MLTFEVLSYLRLTERIILKWLIILIPLILSTAIASYFIYKSYIIHIMNPCTKWTIIVLKALTTKFFFGSFILRALSEYTIDNKQDLIDKANIAQYIGATSLLIWAIFALSSYK